MKTRDDLIEEYDKMFWIVMDDLGVVCEDEDYSHISWKLMQEGSAEHMIDAVRDLERKGKEIKNAKD